MPRKGDFSLGLEAMLNRPEMSPLKNPAVMRELQAKSEMSLGDMIRYVGKGTRTKNGKPKEPTDAEKSKARVEELEAKADAKE